MYERVDKLRADLDKARQKKIEAEEKIKFLEAKLKDAENSQILADVNALKLTPEQLAQFLQMATAGQFGIGNASVLQEPEKPNRNVIDIDTESEDFDDEEDY